MVQLSFMEDRTMGTDKELGRRLFARVVAFVLRYVHFADRPVSGETQGKVYALWLLLTHLQAKTPIRPYVHLSADGPGGGKSIGLEAGKYIACEPTLEGTIRPLGMVRWIEEVQGLGTYLQDEAEKLAAPGANDARSIFTTGYRVGGKHSIPMGSRRVSFSTVSMKAFAAIGDLVNVVRDRCIVLYLEKGKPPAFLTVEEVKGLVQIEADEIRVMIDAWVKSDPILEIEFPEGLDGRDGELWAPMFGAAKALGLDAATMRELSAAAVDLSAEKKKPARKFFDVAAEKAQNDRTYGERAIRDLVEASRKANGGNIGTIYTARAVEMMRDAELFPLSPWRSYGVEGLTQVTLSAMCSRWLGPTIQGRMKGGPVKSCYTKAQLERAAKMIEAADKGEKALSAWNVAAEEGGSDAE